MQGDANLSADALLQTGNLNIYSTASQGSGKHYTSFAMYSLTLLFEKPGLYFIQALNNPSQAAFVTCRYYQKEIAAYDIQTKRVDIYGQEDGYTERAFILYDGLHYDALAQAG